ncbi:MAG: VCBS repeat-containing protein [Planctomycetota bacterium]|nr:VCBS repeat-containing protein [Planctomycetota bacterium]
MMARHAHTLTAALAAALAALPAQARTIASFEADGVLDQRVVDTDGDGTRELVLLQSERLLRVRWRDAAWVPDGQVEIGDPSHTIVALADVLARPGSEVVLADRRRTSCRDWDGGAAVALARRGRFTIRVDRPQFSPFVVDINEDGKLDLMLPGLRGVTPYFQVETGDDGVPDFVRLPQVKVRVRVDLDPGGRGLDQELVGSVNVPQVRMLDLNGDQKPDMLTREGDVHAFHLQGADGTFDQPIAVDIKQFVDSTPKASVDFGRTAVLSDSQQLQRGDVDGDGVPDFVIAHRRKLWTFLGTERGPQFRKARTQAVAEDVTALRMMDLDEDGKDDLVTFRVQVPDVATAVLGLVRSTDVDIRAVGYQSDGTGFAKKPTWRRTVTLRVPALLSLLSRQDELVERFTSVFNEARVSTRGAFTEVDADDLVMVRDEDAVAELYAGVPRAPQLDTAEGIRLLRRLLFEDEDTVFDLDRLFSLMAGFVSRMSEQVDGAREPAATVALRDPKDWRLVVLQSAQLDGAGGDEMLAGYESIGGAKRRVYDLITWRR